MYRLFLLLLVAVAGSALAAHAQVSVEPLTISVTPASPRPYDTVTVTPRSTLIDLAAARITVTVNGKVAIEGSGSQSVPVTVAGPGESTVISIRAVTATDTYTKQVTIRPGDVALVVEPVSTTHPFYLGAALTAPQGRVRIIALPDLRTNPSTRLASANLVYTWRWGDRILTEQSGIGRSILTVTAPVRYRDAQLAVTVTNMEQTLVAESSVVIAPVDPIARIYHADPLMGPDFDRALTGTHVMAGEEEAFRGVAYFFGTQPSLTWSVNSQQASSERDVTVRTTGSGEGTASLSFVAKDGTTGQTASALLPIRFGNKSTNIFGF